eukprot:12614093-Heterocapsa_arctica.AAC.1
MIRVPAGTRGVPLVRVGNPVVRAVREPGLRGREINPPRVSEKRVPVGDVQDRSAGPLTRLMTVSNQPSVCQ